MDCCSSVKKASVIEVVVPTATGVKPQRRGTAHVSLSSSSRKSNLQSQSLLEVFGTLESGRRHIYDYARRRRQPLVLAAGITEPRGCRFCGVDTPLEPSSPEGKLLSGILQNQRHFFEFAVSEQLDEMALDRVGAAAAACSKLSSASRECLLQRRIAEIKEKESQIAIEDIMYMSIVYNFSEVEVALVPKLSKNISNNTLDIWPSKCRELESIHSVEVQEMIREHLATVLRMREKSNTTKIARLHLGRIYAASIMYGYFLKSACFRRQLDSGLAHTVEVEGLQPLDHGTYNSDAELLYSCWLASPATLASLRSYVTGFDSESLQRCAKLQSKEAVNVIERHTWALFGDENENENVAHSDNEIFITIPSLERLVLEAVAFGSFLWDVERSVDSVYGLREA